MQMGLNEFSAKEVINNLEGKEILQTPFMDLERQLHPLLARLSLHIPLQVRLLTVLQEEQV